ncbi:MAG: hypothetical protein Q9220_002326 [cf. Caloplaca sp. 1 TL-2023]
MSNPFRSLWLKWKSLQLPWRKRWLAGTDLNGNSYFYFRPTLSQKPRRLLQQNPLVPYSDIQIPVQWHQWLRHTRPAPPSIQELQIDVQRKAELKQLAAAADARWASKPSVLDAPRRRNQELGVGGGDTRTGFVGRQGESVGGSGVSNGQGQRLNAGVKGEDVRDSWGEGERGRGKNPWKKDRPKNPGETYQPASWDPSGPQR